MKNKQNNLTNISGFTIVEVIIFVGILSLVFVAIVSYTAANQKRITSSITKTYATNLTSELGEYLSSQSLTNWTAFTSFARSATNPTPKTPGNPNILVYSYCANSTLDTSRAIDASPTQMTPGDCSPNAYSLTHSSYKGAFRRNVTFTVNTTRPLDPIPALVTTYWRESGSIKQVDIQYVYAPIQ